MTRAAALPCLLVLGACGDYAAAMHVTFTGERPPAGGGYRVELRRPSGAPLPGVDAAYIEASSGAHDVSLVLENDALFADNDAVELRVYVEVAGSKAGAATAVGTTIFTATEGEVTDVSVALRGPPAGAVLVQGSLTTQRAIELTLDTALTPRSGHRLELWVDGPQGLEQLGELDGSLLSSSFAGGTVGELILTEEPAGSPRTLVRFNGWQLYRGGLPSAAIDLLSPVLDAGGRLPRLMALLEVAKAHAALALGATVASSAALHVEHTFNAVAGSTRAGQDLIAGAPTRDGDLDADGALEFPSSDHVGFGSEVVSDPSGHLGAIEAALEAVSELPDFPDPNPVFQALACIDTMRNAIGNVLGAADGAIDSGTPENDASVQPLVASVDALEGDQFGGGGPQTTLCLQDRLATMTTVTLTPLHP